MDVRCEWDQGGNCTNAATHMVCITFPGEPTENWRVCRAHDRELKKLAVASRVPRPPDPDPPQPAPRVQCSQCGRALQELPSTPIDEREPCPTCGSVIRTVCVTAVETIRVHEQVRIRSKRPGKGGWLKDVKTGDDYTRDLQAWGGRTLESDSEHNQYREHITLYDGTVIESTARLSNHHD
jgi:hypothetical protein